MKKMCQRDDARERKNYAVGKKVEFPFSSPTILYMEIERAYFTDFHEEFREIKIRDVFLKIDFYKVEFAHDWR